MNLRALFLLPPKKYVVPKDLRCQATAQYRWGQDARLSHCSLMQGHRGKHRAFHSHVVGYREIPVTKDDYYSWKLP